MNDRRAVRISVVAIALAAFGASPGVLARQATPETPRQEAPAPGGLEDVGLPADEAGIETLFARLPDELAGEERTRLGGDGAIPGEVTAVYGQQDPDFGPPLFLRALDVSSGDFFEPGSTARTL